MNLTPSGRLRGIGTKIDRLLSIAPKESILVPYAEMRTWRVTCVNVATWYGPRFSTRREGDKLRIYRIS